LIWLYLAGEGLTVLMTGAWLPEAGRTLHVLNAVWLLGCISTAIHRRFPILLIVQGWPFVILFYFFYSGSKSTPHPFSPAIMVYPVMFLICSLAAYFALASSK
jgi:hypothetical protein